jgi:hypothetical protein
MPYNPSETTTKLDSHEQRIGSLDKDIALVKQELDAHTTAHSTARSEATQASLTSRQVWPLWAAVLLEAIFIVLLLLGVHV